MAQGPAHCCRRASGRRSGFNVFSVEDLMLGYHSKPPMAFDRRAFYKISLVRGRSRVEYADKVVDIDQHALWFATSRVPYRWLPHDPAQTGYFCIFTDEFLLPAKGRAGLDELPIFSRVVSRFWWSLMTNTRLLRPFFRR